MKLKSIKFDYQKGQIDQYTAIRSPVQTQVNSESRDPNPNTNDDISTKKNRKNMFEISEHVSKYVF